MHLNAHVDVELVAVEQPDELTVLLELQAPEAPRAEARPPAAVEGCPRAPIRAARRAAS